MADETLDDFWRRRQVGSFGTGERAFEPRGSKKRSGLDKLSKNVGGRLATVKEAVPSANPVRFYRRHLTNAAVKSKAGTRRMTATNRRPPLSPAMVPE